MRKQPYPMVQLTGGLDVAIDPVFLTDKTSPNLRNIRLHKGMIRKELGWTVFSEVDTEDPAKLPLDGPVMLIDTFPMATGTTHALFLTDKYVYMYDSDDETYTIKNKVSGTPVAFTGDLDDPWSSTITVSAGGVEIYLIANGKDYMQYWAGDIGGEATFLDLDYWKSQTFIPKQIVHFKNRLVAGGMQEVGTKYPRRVRWSAAGDPSKCRVPTDAGAGYVDLLDTSDWITCFVIMKDRLFVMKERSIWELEYVGGTTVFTPALKVDGVGSYSPHGVISLDEEMIFYGSDNIYTFDGFSLKPMGGQIYPYLYEALERKVNASVAARFPAAYIEELKLFMLCVAQKFDTLPTLVYKYDYDYDAWTTVEKEMTAIGYWDIAGTSTTTWAELTDTWANQDWIWLSRNLAPGAPTTLIGDSNGYVYEDDRLTPSTEYMRWETKDFVFEHAVRWVEFRIKARYGPFSVKYSTDGGTTWSAQNSFPVSTDWTEYTWLLNITSQKIRFVIECEAESLDIKWLEPWFIPRKRSKTLVTS